MEGFRRREKKLSTKGREIRLEKGGEKVSAPKRKREGRGGTRYGKKKAGAFVPNVGKDFGKEKGCHPTRPKAKEDSGGRKIR